MNTPRSDKASTSSRSGRRRAREFVVQGIYQWLVGGQDEASIQVQTEGVAGFEKADTDLFKSLLHETLLHAGELQAVISPFVTRPWDEVSPIERGILLLATCELQHHIETPYRVIINEAIELTKTFGGSEGHRFVNGVLDKLAPTLRAAEAGKH